jgi:hypothetical protein
VTSRAHTQPPSAGLACPLCGLVSKDNGDNKRWGVALDKAELERAFIEDSDLEGVKSLSDLAAMVNDLVDDEGRATFWCPCGRMMWMQGHGWMVSLDFVMRLARGIRQHHEEEYEAMLLMLSHLMPQEIHRVRAALGEDV